MDFSGSFLTMHSCTHLIPDFRPLKEPPTLVIVTHRGVLEEAHAHIKTQCVLYR